MMSTMSKPEVHLKSLGGAMKRLNIIVALLLLFSFMVGIVGCPKPTPTETQPTGTGQPTGTVQPTGTDPYAGLDPVKIRLASGWANKSLIDVGARVWMRLIEKESGGKIKFTFFGASAMGGHTDVARMVGVGAVDSAICGYMGSISALAPKGNMAASWVLNRMAAYEFSDPWGEWWPALQEESKLGNVLMLVGLASGGQAEGGKIKITDANDLKGKRIFSSGTSTGVQIKAMGATSIFMSFDEGYMGFYKDMIDWCIGSSQPTWIDRSWFEVAPHFSDRSSTWCSENNFQIFFYLPFWNKLAKPYQDLLMDAAIRTQVWNNFESASDWEVTRYELTKYKKMDVAAIEGTPNSITQVAAIVEGRKQYCINDLKVAKDVADEWFASLYALNDKAKTDAYLAKWKPWDDAIQAEILKKQTDITALIDGGMLVQDAFDKLGYRRLYAADYDTTIAEINSKMAIYPGKP